MIHNVEKKNWIILDTGTKVFDYLTGLSETIRPKGDDQPGVNIMFKIILTKSIVHVPIRNPKPLAHDFTIEKSVRTELLGNVTSQESENPTIFRYRGCISYRMPDTAIIHCSVSGLFGSEDVTIAIIAMAKKLNVTLDEVIANIRQRGGALPVECFQEGHYLKHTLDMYR
jgi:hypothetical protein